MREYAVLRGQAVFLSASVPSPNAESQYLRIPDAAIWISEAVIALTRAVRSHGGTIVMAAHPTMSPLVAQVAAEYWTPAATEGGRPSDALLEHPGVVVYELPNRGEAVTDEMRFLAQLGYARVQRAGQLAAGDAIDAAAWEQIFREIDPAAMVCCGGEGDLLVQADIFRRRRPSAPIYALATTGGAAALLPDWARAVDREINERLATLARQHPLHVHDDATPVDRDVAREAGQPIYVPYAVSAQSIVDEIAEHRPRKAPESLG